MHYRSLCLIVVAGVSFTPFLGVEKVSADGPPGQPTANLRKPTSEFETVGHPNLMSPQTLPLVIDGARLFVVNTPADTVDVIDTRTGSVERQIPVGIDPVSIAIRPDGDEIWVSNHVSDTISVIDNRSGSRTFLQVVDTVQEIDPRSGATRFDEPMGIAFANDAKAYVALSSENQIAVIDVPSRQVIRRLAIPAQDPRTIVVQGERLYVIPFESNNKTQLSGGTGKLDGDLVTFNAWEHSIANNNVLSLGHVVDIVKHPRVPDRDLFVFDTNTDELVATVDSLGTLLYGMAIDSEGNVFIAQTDARNDANGRAGTKKHGLAELENRAFLNRITRLSFDGDYVPSIDFVDLEPLPPHHPSRDEALATPFAISMSKDQKTLIVTAAGSDTLFTVDTRSGRVLGRTAVGAVPRGVAVEAGGKSAWVLNAVENSVTQVDVSDPANLEVLKTVPLFDPTDSVVKRGRIAFNSAAASSTGTYSCASCHPDGHTDQLLWVLKTPVVTGGNQIMPRSTMPIRGLRDTEPYHWDGIPGDPYGGNNSANIYGSDPPNSRRDVPTSSTRHLIDGGLAATMKMVGDPTVNDEGKPGYLSAAERDAMATFLLNVPYPPAPRRSFTNVVSDRARRGFELFHIEGDRDGKPRPNVCGNCHRMPFLVSTNTPGTGMDAPTWRGAYDRFLILPQGRLNMIDFDFYREIAERGIPEREMWRFSWGGRPRFDPVWDMVLEASTGFSGAFARQVALNQRTGNEELTNQMLDALELAARERAVVLECDGAFLNGANAEPVSMQFVENDRSGVYVMKSEPKRTVSREQLLQKVANQEFIGTVTAKHGANADVHHPQPGIWTLGPIEKQRGRQEFPILFPSKDHMSISGRHLDPAALVIVDGRRVEGAIELMYNENEEVVVKLETLPDPGLHLLQLQNPNGMCSNDFVFHVTVDAESAAELRRRIDEAHVDRREALKRAISNGDMAEVKRLLDRGARVNERHPDGSTPLNTAALHDRPKIAQLLLERGADVNGKNNDGNTPLHIASFFCHHGVIQVLLDHGATVTAKNRRGESPIELVSAPWTDEVAGVYRFVANLIGKELDYDRLRENRPLVVERLTNHLANERQ